MAEKVGEGYIDLVINEASVNKSLKETKNTIVSEMQGWPTDLKLKPDPNAGRIAGELRLKVEHITQAEIDRLRAIREQNKALDDQIAKAVQLTNQAKAAARSGFMDNLFSKGGLQGNQRQVMNQLTYGLQDFVTVLSMPGMGLGGALRGASNNISMMLMQLTPMAALLSSVAVSALPALFDWLGKTTTKTDELTNSNRQLAESFRYLDQQMSHRGQMRMAADVSGVKTTTQVDDDLIKAVQDRTQAKERQADEKELMGKAQEDLRRRTQTIVGQDVLNTMTGFTHSLRNDVGGALAGTGTGISIEELKREDSNRRLRQKPGQPSVMGAEAARVARQSGLNPDEHQIGFIGDKVIFTRITKTKEIEEIEKRIQELQMQEVKTADELAEKEKKITSLREKRVELTKQEATTLARQQELMGGPMDREHARKLAEAETKRNVGLSDVDKLVAAGGMRPEDAADVKKNINDRFANEEAKIKEENSKRIQTEADKQFNELDAGNRRYQSRQEQVKRFQFGLEMGAVDDRRVFANRRKQAEFQYEEDLRRNEEMTREGSDERAKGARLATNKFRSDMGTIAQDEERAKARVRIDALKHADPRKWALEEAEFRRKERLRQLDLTGATGAERASMESMINKASAMEKVELLKQADKKNPAEFIGGQEMWKKIQLGMLQQPDEVAKATRATADNTGKLVTLFENNKNVMGQATYAA